MRKFKYENGNIVSEKDYAQSLIKSFLSEHLIETVINEIETLEDANKFIQKSWLEWTIDADTVEIIED